MTPLLRVLLLFYSSSGSQEPAVSARDRTDNELKHLVGGGDRAFPTHLDSANILLGASLKGKLIIT